MKCCMEQEQVEKSRSILRSMLSKTSIIFGSKVAKTGVVIILGIVLMVLLGSLFFPLPPNSVTGTPYSPPSFGHPFGTDYLGQDVFSQVVWGAYPSLFIALFVAFASTLIGYFAGIYAGYYRKLEAGISGLGDVILSFPFLPLLLMVGTIFYADPQVVPILLALILWAPVARAVRAQTISAKKLAYVEAARVSGLNDRQIVWKILTFEVAPIAIAYFVINVALGLVLLTAVEFLGVGNPLDVNWGSILYWAQLYAFTGRAWWWILAPGLIIALTTTGFAFIGYSIEEIMNPRLRK